MKSDIPRRGAEVVKISGEGLSLPVDDQSPRCASQSHHRQVEDVVWWRYLVSQRSSSESLKPIRHEHHKG